MALWGTDACRNISWPPPMCSAYILVKKINITKTPEASSVLFHPRNLNVVAASPGTSCHLGQCVGFTCAMLVSEVGQWFPLREAVSWGGLAQTEEMVALRTEMKAAHQQEAEASQAQILHLEK